MPSSCITSTCRSSTFREHSSERSRERGDVILTPSSQSIGGWGLKLLWVQDHPQVRGPFRGRPLNPAETVQSAEPPSKSGPQGDWSRSPGKGGG